MAHSEIDHVTIVAVISTISVVLAIGGCADPQQTISRTRVENSASSYRVKIDTHADLKADLRYLFRAINADTGPIDSIARTHLDRMFCPTGVYDPQCDYAVRWWIRPVQNRLELNEDLRGLDHFKSMLEQGIVFQVTISGTPAFLSERCSDACRIPGQELLRPYGPCVCEDGYQTDPPSDQDAFAAYVQDIVEQLMAMVPLGRERQVAFSTWNEGDLSAFWTGTDDQLLMLLAVMRQTIIDTLAQDTRFAATRVGGSDLSRWDAPYAGVTDAPLLIDAQAEQLPFDYVTHHAYSPTAVQLIQDSLGYIQRSQLSAGYARPTPIDLTEYNVMLVDGGEPASCEDPSKGDLCDHRGAAGLVARAISFAEQGYRRLYAFNLNDYGTSEFLTTQLGAYTSQWAPKPEATALWMLSHLKGRLTTVINQLTGAHPYHLAAAQDGARTAVVVAAEDYSTGDMFARGVVMTSGQQWDEIQQQLLSECPAAANTMVDIDFVQLAEQQTVIELRDYLGCNLLSANGGTDNYLSDEMALIVIEAAQLAVQRESFEGTSFDLTIALRGLQKVSPTVTRYRITETLNTHAEAWRAWACAESICPPEADSASAHLWDYMLGNGPDASTRPKDQLSMQNGAVTVTIEPNSTTLLLIE